MNNPTNQQPDVMENIDRYLEDGLPVFDQNGTKVGDVKMYSAAAGYLLVASGAFELQTLYIPFRLIRSIDPRAIFLATTRERLTVEYSQPPQTQTIVETRLVAGPHGGLRPQTREVQVVQSGSYNALAELNSADVNALASRLAVGMAVYDVDGARLGDITQYDTTRGLLVVEQGILKPTILLIPFSDIQSISLDNLSVYLSMPKDAVVKEHRRPAHEN